MRIGGPITIAITVTQVVAEQGQPRDAKKGVEDVGHVPRAVRDAPVLLVLALEDEGLGGGVSRVGECWDYVKR